MLSLLWLAISSTSPAQAPPYDIAPAAEPPYYRVRYAASQHDAELSFGVQYTLWLPPGVDRLRGVIVHQHGCGEGSCKSGLTGAYDLHWQALAAKHHCALLAPAYEQPEKADCQLWCDPRHGSDDSFRRSLADFSTITGHGELADVPWALWGHSGGGHWAGGMVMLHPERVVAAWLRSGVPLLEANAEQPWIQPHVLTPAALQVPMMCNLGVQEGVTNSDGRFAGVWPANQRFFQQIRSQGGLIGVAIDPLTSHECGNQRYLAIPWLDACLTARLPERAGEPLRTMPTQESWFQPDLTGKTAVPLEQLTGNPLAAGWLPNSRIAAAWMEYADDTVVQDTTAPPAPYRVRVNQNRLRWECMADMESGLSHFQIERDGTVIARVPETGSNPFGRPVFQGLQYSDTPPQPLAEMSFTDNNAMPGVAYQYTVRAVNTQGLSSDPSLAEPEAQPLWRTSAPIGEGPPVDGQASVTVYRPRHPNGLCVVICPGGGYGGLAVQPEGHQIARWLNRHAITGVVLEYRMPQGNHMVPLLDAQRAIRWARAEAASWQCDPQRVGILGFSAGGHLASTAATHFDSGNPAAVDAVEQLSSRPDFAALIYPVITMGEFTHAGSRRNLLGETPAPSLIAQYSNERRVSKDTPPVFLAHPQDDHVVPVENSRMFAQAMRDHERPVRYLELPFGDHGLNGYQGPMWDAWQTGLLEWLAELSLLQTADNVR